MSEDSTSTISQAKELTDMMANLGEANAIEWDCLLSCKRIHIMKMVSDKREPSPSSRNRSRAPMPPPPQLQAVSPPPPPPTSQHYPSPQMMPPGASSSAAQAHNFQRFSDVSEVVGPTPKKKGCCAIL